MYTKTLYFLLLNYYYVVIGINNVPTMSRYRTKTPILKCFNHF